MCIGFTMVYSRLLFFAIMHSITVQNVGAEELLFVFGRSNGTELRPNMKPEPTEIPDEDEGFDGTMLWYMISFGGVIAFFIIVSCFEYFCSKQRRMVYEESVTSEEVPPPPYDLFAPPDYDSLFNQEEKSKTCQIYIIQLEDSSTELTEVTSTIPSTDVPSAEPVRTPSTDFGEVISRNSMGDGEVVTPPPPP